MSSRSAANYTLLIAALIVALGAAACIALRPESNKETLPPPVQIFKGQARVKAKSGGLVPLGPNEGVQIDTEGIASAVFSLPEEANVLRPPQLALSRVLGATITLVSIRAVSASGAVTEQQLPIVVSQ